VREDKERKEDRFERVGKGEIAPTLRCRLIDPTLESN
jgi:hypothetical protein